MTDPIARDTGAYRLPASVRDVPHVRRLGMHHDGDGWVEHVCTCPTPCNRADCANVELMPRPMAVMFGQATEKTEPEAGS